MNPFQFFWNYVTSFWTYPLWYNILSVILIISIPFWFIAGTNLYKQQEKARETQTSATPKNETTQELRKPNLKLFMSGANVFIPDAPDVRNRLTGIVIDAKIWNTGASSVATEWNLCIIPEGGLPVVAQLTKIPNNLRVRGELNSFVINSSESLEDKVSQNHITTMPVTGKLLFYVQLPKEVVQRPSTRWELSVKDIYGKETKFSQRVGDWLAR